MSDSDQFLFRRVEYEALGGTALWGGVTGTLSDQTDLWTYLSNPLTAYSLTGHFTGFPNRTDTSISWSDVTYTLTLTASSDSIWIYGVPYSIDTLTKQLTVGQEAATDVYWFWITAPGGVLQLNCDAAAPGFDKCLVATVYWNTTTSKGILVDERHHMARNKAMHEYLHETVGARYASGLAGTFDNTTITIGLGEYYDEDIEHISTQQTTCRVLYHNGDSDWAWDDLTTPYKVVNPGVDNTLYYNNGTALASVGLNKFVVSWIFITGDETKPVHVVIGTAQHNTITLARAEALTNLGDLTSPEDKLIYRVIYKNVGGTPTYQEASDYRTVTSLPSSYTPTAIPYDETIYSVTATTATTAIDTTAGRHIKLTLSASTTINFINPPGSGFARHIVLSVIQDGVGSWSVSGFQISGTPVTPKYTGGSAPTLTGTASSRDDFHVILETSTITFQSTGADIK